MSPHQNPQYPDPAQEQQQFRPYNPEPPTHPGPVYSAPSEPSTSPTPIHDPSYEYSRDNFNPKFDTALNEDAEEGSTRRISKKWQKRLYWIVPVAIVVIVLVILFEVYKSDFERWVKPLTDWLKKREAWSWTLPVAILIILSFPPLFGHEIVQLVVGLTYPLGIAIGIACAGAVLGEAACFVVFKYGFTSWVDKKIRQKIKWAATARVTQEAGFRGVLVIRYSIVPPHLANPLFACTGMSFWLYMATVFLSLPKSIVFVALGAPGSENSKGVKIGKVIAIGVLIVVTIFASRWMRKRLAVATKEIQAERAAQGAMDGDEELGMLAPNATAMGAGDTSYKGVASADPYPDPVQGSSRMQLYSGT